VAKNWYSYASGRAADDGDSCNIDSLSANLADTGGNIRELVVAIATSPAFRNRRIVP
jgi:hypothetical protein